jgi:hypothetical protein
MVTKNGIIFIRRVILVEIWKIINDYFNYEISNLGNIRSHKSGEPKLLKGGYDKDGYHLILLYNEKGRVTRKVHRLVAEYFVDNPDNKPHVNHKDGNKKNNNANNLEWVTPSENTQHSFDVLGKKTQFSYGKRPVVQKDKITGAIIKVHESAKDAEKDGFYRQNIVGVCKGRAKTHRGYSWSYL